MFLDHEQVLYLKMKDFIVELSKEGGIKMLRILLACAGGMSTSLLMNKMKEEAEQRGIEVSVDAVGEKTIGNHIGNFDVLLLGPQVRYVLKNVQDVVGDKAPFDVIDMRDYGTMNGAKVLDQAIKMYESFYHKKVGE